MRATRSRSPEGGAAIKSLGGRNQIPDGGHDGRIRWPQKPSSGAAGRAHTSRSARSSHFLSKVTVILGGTVSPLLIPVE